MFNTLKWFWSTYWITVKRGRPNKRAFYQLLIMIKIEIIFILITGYTADQFDEKIKKNE